jgi:hypothetical protein
MDEEAKAIEVAAAGLTEANRNQTAKKAARILLESGAGFALPTASQKRQLRVEFSPERALSSMARLSM